MRPTENLVISEMFLGNGQTASFKLSNDSVLPSSEHVLKNGVRQVPGIRNDYTISKNVITFSPGNIPGKFTRIIVDYIKG